MSLFENVMRRSPNIRHLSVKKARIQQDCHSHEARTFSERVRNQRLKRRLIPVRKNVLSHEESCKSYWQEFTTESQTDL